MKAKIMTVVFTLVYNSFDTLYPHALVEKYRYQKPVIIAEEGLEAVKQLGTPQYYMKDVNGLRKIVTELCGGAQSNCWIIVNSSDIKAAVLNSKIAHRVLEMSRRSSTALLMYRYMERVYCCRTDMYLHSYETPAEGETMLCSTIKEITDTSRWYPNRTGIRTKRKFFTHQQFSLADGAFPMSTVKCQNFRWILEELLWILRGETDVELLQSKGIHIWDKNVARETLPSDLEVELINDVGASYGWNMRHFGAPYPGTTARKQSGIFGGADQLAMIIDSLTNDPFGRRHIISLWDPNSLKRTVLPPCELFYEFYVEYTDDDESARALNCFALNRSSDIAMAGSWNMCTAALLTIILAKTCGMTPGLLVWAAIDTHIYENNYHATLKVLENTPRGAPQLVFTAAPTGVADIERLSVDDFHLFNYEKYYTTHHMNIN